MKKILFLLFALTAAIRCSAQAYPHYFYSNEPANTSAVIKQNKIRTEHTYAYTLSTNVLKSMIIKDSVLLYTCSYDELGRPLIRQRLSKRSVLKDSLVYDASGERVTMYGFSIFSGTDHPLSKEEYTYDKTGNILVFKGEFYTQSSITAYSTRYVYNAKGQLTREYSSYHDTVNTVTVHEYDTDGNRIRSLTEKPDGQMYTTLSFEYNRDKTKVTHYSVSGSIKKEDYKIEYDAKGRCTLLLKSNRRPVSIDLFSYSANGLFSEMREVQSGFIKKLERHFYFTD